MTRHTLAISATLALLLSTAPASAYQLVPDALDPQACQGQGCWTNHLRVTDLDGDGDLDILLANYADFFAGADKPQPLVVYLNNGMAEFSNESAAAVGDYVGNVRQVAVGDVDGDGDLDLYAPDGAGAPHVLFINDGAGVFTDEAAERLPAGSFPQGAAARMGDVDGDGDLDILAGDGYSQGGGAARFARLYRNDGSGNFEEVADAVPAQLQGVDVDDFDLLDVDRDFDLDLLVNPHANGGANLWKNDGTGQFTAADFPPAGNSGYHYNPGVCDVDGDGDLDVWVDNIGGGYNEQLLINDGAGGFTDETAARVTGNNAGSDDNGVVCADIDDDGDFDAVVVSLSSPERYLVNDGTGNFVNTPGVFPGPTDCSLWAEFGDLDDDGRLDLVTGQGECSSSDEVYLAEADDPVDSQPPKLLAVEEVAGPVDVDAAPVVRFAVSDRTVTDEGPRLARAYAVIDPDGAATMIDAAFMGGDLFRVVLPPARGAVVFRVCAEDDNGNTACAADQSYQAGEDPGTTTDGDTTDGDTTDGDTTNGDTTAATGNDSTTAAPGTTGERPTTGEDPTTGEAPTTDATASAGTSDASSGGDESSGGATGSSMTDGSGCGCASDGDPRPGWLALLTAVALLRRRRR
ncbi:MYXO-CTERM domain-containing protein [Nannocystis exedens]|uniref:MYXO-CTERM domain-containing protein n=1 Tax=Nannocystis exedens TaxID=54 RepID=A0A1I2GNT3_9BACT|nr:FG-GAP-like repeat-containing protein [Nannocystis exedens]PCC68724.1 MYXO-CTERM sorting domain-containing protein [Nannocystis exedens]SFF19225.1 MYXO-CTERM domain-containing protein [Nannocystis exedens]